MGVQKLADRLDLREDEAALRGAGVDGRHEDDRVPGLREVARDQAVGFGAVLEDPHDFGAQVFDALARRGARRHHGKARGVRRGEHLGVGLAAVALVDDDDHGGAERLRAADQFGFGADLIAAQDDQRQVDPFEHREAAAHARGAQFAHVVHARRVDEDDGADGREFAGFLDGVRRRAGDVRDDGDLLTGERVRKRAFPCVARTEEADVQAQAFWGVDHGVPCGGWLKKRTARIERAVRERITSEARRLPVNYFSMLVRTTSRSSQIGAWCSAASQLMVPGPKRQMPLKCSIERSASGMWAQTTRTDTMMEPQTWK